MGLDEDLKFKVWCDKEYGEMIFSEIEKVLGNERKTWYLKNLAVIGLETSFTLTREAGMTQLPGLKLVLSNGREVTLTAFFRGGTSLYALTSSHLEDLTGREVKYRTGPDTEQVLLGKIVAHVCEGDPFREACLVKVNAGRVGDVSEYLTDITNGTPGFIHDIYRGDIDSIPVNRREGKMVVRPGQSVDVKIKCILEWRPAGGPVLKDCIFWTCPTNHGRPGESGSAILGTSLSGNIELMAMYIGQGGLNGQRVLVSHGIPPAIDYFSSQLHVNLQVYNPSTMANPIQAGHQFQFHPAGGANRYQDRTPPTNLNVTSVRNLLQRNAKRRVLKKQHNMIVQPSEHQHGYKMGPKSQGKSKNGQTRKRFIKGVQSAENSLKGLLVTAPNNVRSRLQQYK